MRKELLSAFAFSLLSFSAFGQVLSIKELIDYTKCKDFTCFNELIVNKGYSYDETTTESNGKTYRYSSDQRFPITSTKGLDNKNTSSLFFQNNGTIAASVYTCDKSQYQALMTQLRALQFKPVLTKNDDLGIAVVYSSSQLPKISMIVRTGSQNHAELGKFTYYLFQALRNP